MGTAGEAIPTDVNLDDATVFCCDADALINLEIAGLLKKVRAFVRSGQVRVPEGVQRELLRVTDHLASTMRIWERKYSVAVDLDYKASQLLPEIERTYGPPFQVGQKMYRGFWQSASGRKSADGQVVALAKARGWIAVSNDDSVHGACMLEGVACRRWEEIGRLLLKSGQLSLL